MDWLYCQILGGTEPFPTVKPLSLITALKKTYAPDYLGFAILLTAYILVWILE
jgi:hypothetical protein